LILSNVIIVLENSTARILLIEAKRSRDYNHYRKSFKIWCVHPEKTEVKTGFKFMGASD